MKAKLYLPLALLLSSIAYCMDGEKFDNELIVDTVKQSVENIVAQPIKAEEFKETADLPMPTKSLAKVENKATQLIKVEAETTDLKAPERLKQQQQKATHVLTFNTVQSMVFDDITSKDLTTNNKVSDEPAAKDLAQSLSKRGYITTLSYYMQPIKTLISDLKSGNFAIKVHANRDYLINGLKSLIATPSHENLEYIHQILSACKEANIPLTDPDLATSIRAYAQVMRTKDEATLSKNVIAVSASAQDARLKEIDELKKGLAKLKAELEKQSKKYDEDLKGASADQPHIAKATTIKQLVKEVCPTLKKSDGYDSDNEGSQKRTYDLAGVLAKLKLDSKVESAKERNRRVVINAATLLEQVVAKMDTLILMPNDVATQPVNQQQ